VNALSVPGTGNCHIHDRSGSERVQVVAATPTTPKGQRTRESIIAAGRKVFAQDGFVASRMSDVATAAGISLGGMYRYFTDKEDLFEAVIADVHEQLYQASTSPEAKFTADPYAALLSSNRGYLQQYYENRDVMRAFMEAAHVEPRFRDFWWRMRTRHITRFVSVMRSSGMLDGDFDLQLATEAMACMVEQAAYVWFAQEQLHGGEVDPEEAAQTVTRGWYRMFFDAAISEDCPA
jgi:AcrR family transcriptional regulator